jgi:type IV pilus assembly protein PilE
MCSHVANNRMSAGRTLECHRAAGDLHRGGFSLMELVIAVAVIGILAAIAFPSYQAQIRRSARAEAQAYMMDASAREQQYMIDRRTYAALEDLPNLAVPADLAAKYNFTIVTAAGPPPTFTISAEPYGEQASDGCGTLALDSIGNKTASGSAPNCW